MEGHEKKFDYISFLFKLSILFFSFFSLLGDTSIMESQYSSALTNASQTFCRTGFCSRSSYYYQALLINVSRAAYYNILCNSSMDTYGYIYKNSFNPAAPSANLISYNDDDGGNDQFLLSLYIDTVAKYILVVTTNRISVMGKFSIIATGQGSVSFIVG